MWAAITSFWMSGEWEESKLFSQSLPYMYEFIPLPLIMTERDFARPPPVVI